MGSFSRPSGVQDAEGRGNETLFLRDRGVPEDRQIGIRSEAIGLSPSHAPIAACRNYIAEGFATLFSASRATIGFPDGP